MRTTQTRKVEFEHVEVLTSDPNSDLQERLHQLGDAIDRLLSAEDPPEAIALERVFAQQNLPSVMGVAQISGIVFYLAAKRGIPVTYYTPNEVKSRVTGYGAADKAQVTGMVTRLLGLKQPPKPADAADALALALTHAWNLTRAGGGVATGSKRGSSAQGQSGRPVRAETPAQRAWREAERARGTRRGVQRG